MIEISTLKFRIRKMWPFRKTITPYSEMQELLELMIKAGRRCAYDLKHASDDVSIGVTRNFYRTRANMWLTIFNPADAGKDYRSSMHREIFTLECEVKRLKDLCIQNGIDPTDGNSLPF